MNILHLSDFHYCSENLVYDRVINAIIDSIIKEGVHIDAVLFTGDLVYYGNRVEDYCEAKKALFDRLVTRLGVSPTDILFCPGNHDINRDKIYPTAENSFNTLYNSNEAINRLYQSKDSSFDDSLLPSKNYLDFEASFYDKNGDKDILKPLYAIHFRSFNGVEYGFVSINTAWISALDKKGETDRGNLLYPTEALSEAISYLKKVKCTRVLLCHHPFHFLREYNATEIENLVFNNFDLLFSGHVHKAHSNSGHNGANGIYSHIAKASLSHDESSQGCSIVSLKDYEDNEVRVRELTYIPESDECHIGVPVIYTIPAGEEKIKAIKFRNLIADKCLIELDNAQKLLLLDDDGDPTDFLTLFSFPQLRTRSDDSFTGSETSDIISAETLLLSKDSYLLLGRDKCGKTTLLKWLQISFLKSYSRYQIIPFYINCKEIEPKVDADFSIENEVRNYYCVNKNKAKEICASDSFVLLVDNYSDNTATSRYLKEFIDEHADCRYVVCSEYMTSKPISSYAISSRAFKGCFFQDLNRTDIVKYVEKRISQPASRGEMNEQIVRLCKQMLLPLNYWTISLLLLIHKKSSDVSKNIYEILDVCIDELFGKKERALKGADISFEKLKRLCAYLAMKLFQDYESNVYSAKKEEILSIIASYIEDDDRLEANASDVFEFFCQSGVLKMKNQGVNDYVFRHNGFFEYFLALRMTEDRAFRDYILNDPNLYLAFKNEWDVYSAIRRSDGDFLKTIDEKTNDSVNKVLSVKEDSLDRVLVEKGSSLNALENKYRSILADDSLTESQKALLEDSMDALKQDSDVKPIADYVSEGLTPDLVERNLFILGRVFRNSDSIPKSFADVKDRAFNRVLCNYANLAFYSVDYIASQAESVLKENGVAFAESQEKEILKLMTDFSPLVSQVSLAESIGQKSMINLLKVKYQSLEPDIKNNQYLAFLIVFVLADIELERHLDYVESLMDIITIPILKTMLYFKLNYYMAFKAGGKKALQKRLKLLIRDQRHNLDQTIQDGTQQKSLQQAEKRSEIIKRKGKV